MFLSCQNEVMFVFSCITPQPNCLCKNPTQWVFRNTQLEDVCESIVFRGLHPFGQWSSEPVLFAKINRESQLESTTWFTERVVMSQVFPFSGVIRKRPPWLWAKALLGKGVGVGSSLVCSFWEITGFPLSPPTHIHVLQRGRCSHQVLDMTPRWLWVKLKPGV